MRTSARPPHPGVLYPPPFLFVIALFAGWLLHRLRPVHLFGAGARPAIVVIGWLLVLSGASLSGWAMATFYRARTSMIPNRPATALVTHGPFQFSRNPMYVGLTILYLGVTLLMNSAWPTLFLPVALVLLYVGVIQREEEYLAEAFGMDYLEYYRRVRRWF